MSTIVLLLSDSGTLLVRRLSSVLDGACD